jgi:hypothetical protein
MTKQETILREAIRREIRKELNELSPNGQSSAKLSGLEKKAELATGLGQFKNFIRMMKTKGASEQFDTMKTLITKFQLKPQAVIELKNWIRKADTKKGLTSRK